MCPQFVITVFLWLSKETNNGICDSFIAVTSVCNGKTHSIWKAPLEKDGDGLLEKIPISKRLKIDWVWSYLIFVIFFTQAKFLENKIYTEKRQFLPIFRQFLPIYTEICTEKRQFLPIFANFSR